MPSTIVRRTVQVVLTQKELLDIGQEMARSQRLLNDAEGRKAEVAAQIKAEIEGFRNTISDLAMKISQRYEYRTVDCEIVKDFEGNRVDVVRLDNGEVIETRAMTAEERQTVLDLSGPVS